MVYTGTMEVFEIVAVIVVFLFSSLLYMYNHMFPNKKECLNIFP